MNDDDPVSRQLRHYNARDLEPFVACFSPEIVVADGDGRVVMEGREVFRQWYDELFSKHPDLRCEIVHRIRVGQQHVVDEETIFGRGPAPLHVVAVYTIRDAVITRVVLLRET